MGRLGVHKTTIDRIAEEVGMESASLYAHYRSRNEMMLAAIQLLDEKIDRWLGGSSELDALERLRAIGESHEAFAVTEFGTRGDPTFEFLLACRESDLAETVAGRQRRSVQILAGIVEQGKHEGIIREDLDPRAAAYGLLACAWAEDLARLMSLNDFGDARISERMLDLLLNDMRVDANGGVASTSRRLPGRGRRTP